MIKEKIKSFYGSKFRFEGKLYQVKNCDVKSEKACIYTDKRTFAFYENELDDFMLKIEFIDSKETNSVSISENAKPEVVVENVNLAIKEVIISANQRASRMADKLEDMFNKLSDAPTDETIKQAQAMRDMSNSIVNVEMMKFKLLAGL